LKEKIKKDAGFAGILIRISAVGATIGRPYKKFGRDVVFSDALCYNGTNKKPPSEREGGRVSGGRSLRDFEFRLASL